ncbi:hypothetical protein DPEC_G00125460 [Dallia pectoralis]|uniref:Uncharacterized protein n=1 Tax=Dallia pectoralis TaxID=75939 RepID=A0ACC2GRT0_DALPE|nr:hypothetical protein DPEC_G00125460 [Dallia pectoralis]
MLFFKHIEEKPIKPAISLSLCDNVGSLQECLGLNPGPEQRNESNWVSMLEQEEGEEVVSEILDDLMSLVMEKCYMVYLQRQLVPFTVFWARDSLVQILEWHFLVQDKGEGPDGSLSWTEDTEPQPSVIDSWAPGCVLVRKVEPTKHFPPLQRSAPADEAGGRTGQRANHRTHNMSLSTSSPNPSEKRELRDPGLRGFKISDIPPPIPKGRPSRRPKLPPTNPTKDCLPSPNHLLTRSVTKKDMEGEEGDCAEPSSTMQNVKLKPEAFPAIPRLDLARLPRRCVLPQYEVLNSSPSMTHSWRSRGSVGKQSKKQLTTQTTTLIPLTNNVGQPRPQRNGALTGEINRSIRRSVTNVEESVPFYGSLLLDSMELAPGVTLTGPQGTRFSPFRGCPAQPTPSTKLKPIQSNPPGPRFPLLVAASSLSSPHCTEPNGA